MLSMLSMLFVVFLVLWLLGPVSSSTFGAFIHILLVATLVVVVVRLVQGRRVIV